MAESVCTGAFPLVGARLALGRRITTHHDFIHDLWATGGSDVVEGVRFVGDDNLVTTADVISGIEMSLWLVERIYGADLAATARAYFAYELPAEGSGRGETVAKGAAGSGVSAKRRQRAALAGYAS